VKGSDKRVLMIVGGIVLLGALWFGLISPKRSELSKLEGDVAAKQAEVSQQEQAAAGAQTAKDSYETDYRQLITLGKAVPADDDTSSLIDQIQGLAEDSGVEFLGLKLSEGAGGAAPPEPPPDATGTNAAAPAGDTAASGDASTSPEASTTGDPAAADAAATTTAAPATETAAADLPLGATVGAAGLPVMPYELTFRGSFFEVADFLAAIDGLVHTGTGGIRVDGRLLTVSRFDLHPDEAGSGDLAVALTVTSYVAPADQGATAGASPASPTAVAAAPAPTTTPTDTAAPTAAVAAPAP
jgi:Tfp pilus assembly protein PilO